jgi:CheY-like chemotaxis protein
MRFSLANSMIMRQPMIHPIFRMALGLAFLLAASTTSIAQEKPDAKDKGAKPAPDEPLEIKKDKDKAPPPPKKGDDYREFFKPPTTVDEFWEAVTFELDVGKFELAAKQLRGLMNLRPKGEDLFKIEESQGLPALLRLQRVPKWSTDEKIDTQAKKDVAEFLDILARYHTDPKRIAKFITNLNAEPEERTYAIAELQRSGAAAVPPMIAAIREASGSERANIVNVLPKLGKEAGVAIVAALDVPDNALRLDLLDVIRQRLDKAATPFLWHLWGSEKIPETVRAKAGQLLSYFQAVEVAKLPPAKVALTQLADRYYYHQVAFPDPNAVIVWRWDGKQLVQGWGGQSVLSANRAEDYLGLRAAKEALDLDPTYEPAQIAFISLALDKTGGKGESIQNLLGTVNPGLLTAVLERALADRRQAVVLGTIKALGELAEIRASKGKAQSEPVLVRSLYYPDRRVQLAAAESLIRIPSKSGPPSIGRIVEILRRGAASEPQEKAPPKILVGFFNNAVGQEVANAVNKAGFTAVPVKTGREAVKRLGDAADIDGLLLDTNLPDPGLSQLLGQLRADANVGHLPIVLAAPREGIEKLRRHLEPYRNISVIPAPQALDVDTLKRVLKEPNPDNASQPLTEAERKEQAEKSLRLLAKLRQSGQSTSALEPAADVLINALAYPKLSPETMTAVLDTVGELPGQKAQRELAAFVVDAKQPANLRMTAAADLVRHVQQYGLLLSPAQVDTVVQVYNAKATDAKLRDKVAPFLGSLRPDAKKTGERLIEFNSQESAPPPAPKEK